jgi:hypothetical protein
MLKETGMKIMILGLGKSGTTALLYKVAAGLPGCEAFSGGRPGKYVGEYKHAVYKHTYEARKGKDFDLYREHLENECYDRMIWISRDPRDAAVSRMLYRWHRGCAGHRKQFLSHLELVRMKEQNPASIPFIEICRHAAHEGWPVSAEAVIEEERVRYAEMTDFVGGLGRDWFLFSYEDMVAGNVAALNAWLGFAIGSEAEIPESTGKAKVVRKKATGDWRHWFTQVDVDCLKSAYLPYMKLTGYDCDDWRLSPHQVIEPEFSSGYMQRLTERVVADNMHRFRDGTARLLRKVAS